MVDMCLIRRRGNPFGRLLPWHSLSAALVRPYDVAVVRSVFIHDVPLLRLCEVLPFANAWMVIQMGVRSLLWGITLDLDALGRTSSRLKHRDRQMHH